MENILYDPGSIEKKPLWARGQEKRSIAFKWGIVRFCSSNTFEDMIKNKKCHFSKFSQFCDFT